MPTLPWSTARCRVILLSPAASWTGFSRIAQLVVCSDAGLDTRAGCCLQELTALIQYLKYNKRSVLHAVSLHIMCQHTVYSDR